MGLGLLFAVLTSLAILDKYHPSYPRKGFLPMETTRGDRFFISVMCLLFISFTWLKYLPGKEAWGALGISAVVAFIVLKWG